jgi:hypothetical protein
VFSDDFSEDTRGDYVIEGEVAWEPGKLNMPEGASIGRTINGGPWAEIRLQVEPVELTTAQSVSKLLVRFNLDGATDCHVRLRRELQDGRGVASVALVDTGERDGKPIEQLVRQAALGNVAPDSLSLEYRHGLIRVMFPGGQSFSANIENGSATVASVSCEANGSRVRLLSFAVTATRPDKREFTEAEKQRLAEATARERELITLSRQGSSRTLRKSVNKCWRSASWCWVNSIPITP